MAAMTKETQIREMLERDEEKMLSPHAQLSSRTKGRMRQEEACELRPAFQHDRDRILHSKSFRRLKHKTQVFLAPTGDHYRTRLTHTLEVSQIARTIAKSLRLNEDLTEAIALGHDLGHTSFGHAGESVLNEIVPGGFRHPEQSLRVVDVLENDGRGLNLTYEVRDGILRHSKGEGDIISDEPQSMPETLEGCAVRVADIIAYVNHDIDDAIRAGVISYGDLPRDCVQFLGDSQSSRIDAMVKDVVRMGLKYDGGRVALSEPFMEATMKLRAFLYSNVYFAPAVYANFIKASKILKELYNYFLENEEQFLKESGMPNGGEPLDRRACDFVAGMTDRYAFSFYEKLFLPQPWLIM
jgi:dGTPase